MYAFHGSLVPYNDPKLTQDGGFTRNSPFLIAMENSGTKVLPHIFNAVIVTTIISAGNSNIYSGSRILYGLAQAGVAPKFSLEPIKVVFHSLPLPLLLHLCIRLLGMFQSR